jgi:[ribosomal protein S5]-alanine N-acetyltransferase
MNIEPKRLYLRRFKAKDLPALMAMESDVNVMQFTSFRRALSPQEIETRLYKTLASSVQRDAAQSILGIWGAFSLSNDDFIGWSMLEDTQQPFLEIGYMLPQHQWGKGYATEIVRSLQHLAFTQLEQPGLWAITQAENPASIAVLLKCGFIFQGYLPEGLHSYQCLNP